MLPMYYRRANAAIVVYDVTSEESFDQVTVWIKGGYSGMCVVRYLLYDSYHFQSFKKTFPMKLVSRLCISCGV